MFHFGLSVREHRDVQLATRRAAPQPPSASRPRTSCNSGIQTQVKMFRHFAGSFVEGVCSRLASRGAVLPVAAATSAPTPSFP